MALDPRLSLLATGVDPNTGMAGFGQGMAIGKTLQDMARQRRADVLGSIAAEREAAQAERQMGLQERTLGMQEKKAAIEQQAAERANMRDAIQYIGNVAQNAKTPQEWDAGVQSLAEAGIIKPEIAQKYAGQFGQRGAVLSWAQNQMAQFKDLPTSAQEFKMAQKDPAFKGWLDQRYQRDLDKVRAGMDARASARAPQTVTTKEGIFLLNPDGSLGNRLGTPPADKGNQSNLSPIEQREFFEADDTVKSGNIASAALARALELNDAAYSGAFAGERRTIARNLGVGDDSRIQATTEFENLIQGQALESLKTTFGAAPTEGERKILLELQASVDKSPAERKALLERAIQVLGTKVKNASDKMSRLSSGSFFDTSAPAQPTASPPTPPAADPLGIR